LGASKTRPLSHESRRAYFSLRPDPDDYHAKGITSGTIFILLASSVMWTEPDRAAPSFKSRER
jgi:hypothetical protein